MSLSEERQELASIALDVFMDNDDVPTFKTWNVVIEKGPDRGQEDRTT